MDIEKIIDESIIEFNKSQSKFKINNSDNFELIGQNSSLDSMAIVDFLVLLEEKLNKELNLKIDLVNKIFSSERDKLFIKDLISILKN